MVTQKEIGDVIKILKKEYPIREFPVSKERDPYYVLISCILSLRTKDEVTEKASERLFKLAKTPQEMVRLKPLVIRRAIYPVGFYNTKAKTIKEISGVLIEKYEGKVPDKIEELLKLKGVGRKTANIVITHAFGKLGIAVDIHVHVIANRLGWVKTKTAEDTEFVLRAVIPRKYWIILNRLFVKHGQKICLTVSPYCSRCPVRKYCLKVGVVRSR
jgi:endonuclease-3